jgi:hypothetical protein
MKYAVVVVRTLLGLAFLVLGLNHFFGFLSMPQPALALPAKSLMTALAPTGYLDVIKVIEVAGGFLLLTRLFVPLGLVLLTPVIVNIALFDSLLMRQPGLGVPLLCVAIFLIWSYRAYFKPLFTLNAVPTCCAARDRASQIENPRNERMPVAGTTN